MEVMCGVLLRNKLVWLKDDGVVSVGDVLGERPGSYSWKALTVFHVHLLHV